MRLKKSKSLKGISRIPSNFNFIAQFRGEIREEQPFFNVKKEEKISYLASNQPRCNCVAKNSPPGKHVDQQPSPLPHEFSVVTVPGFVGGEITENFP